MELVVIQKKIHEIRGHKVMLDFDLAELYQVENRALKQAVKRNINRFPDDFMFVLSKNEINLLVSQNVIPSKSYFGGAMPFAFTEHGVTMLSSILKSKKAIEVNISIVRAFIALKQFALNYKELGDKITELEHKYNKKFADVYEALDLLLQENVVREDFSKRKRIGYKMPKK
jgi:hypothetical protein